ncbi:hypothetical protein GCM10010219_14560 [Streptomyces netropsis]|nr:hypothetical protein GCM10010219_14560 [Streptomyces netropsis]
MRRPTSRPGGLFALDGGLTALLRSALSEGPLPRVAVGLASGFLAISLAFIVLAVLPRLGDEGTSFPTWA